MNLFKVEYESDTGYRAILRVVAENESKALDVAGNVMTLTYGSDKARFYKFSSLQIKERIDGIQDHGHNMGGGY